MLSAISAIATLTCSGDAVAPTGWIWLLFFTAVPLLLVCLGGRPTPTTRQVSSGGPPPQLLRDPGQPPDSSFCSYVRYMQRTNRLCSGKLLGPRMCDQIRPKSHDDEPTVQPQRLQSIAWDAPLSVARI
jgi:hypothetical protein